MNIKQSSNKLITLLSWLLLLGCDDSTTANAQQTPQATQSIDIDIYTLNFPSQWERWPDNELGSLRTSLESNLRDIYYKYNQAPMPNIAVKLTAFRTPDKQINLFIAIMQLPYKEGLFATLRDEAADKAKWGIQQGFITRASATLPIDKPDYDGFYITMFHADKSLSSSAGIMNKRHQGQMVSLELMPSAASRWTEADLKAQLLEVVSSVQTKETTSHQ